MQKKSNNDIRSLTAKGPSDVLIICINIVLNLYVLIKKNHIPRRDREVTVGGGQVGQGLSRRLTAADHTEVLSRTGDRPVGGS